MDKNRLKFFEKLVKKEWEKGNIKAPVHLSGGNEDELIEIFKQVDREDYVFSTWRSHYHYILHTTKMGSLLLEVMSGRSMHILDDKCHFYTSSIVGGTASIAVGVAVGLKMQKSPRKVWCFIGDGACDSGWVFEAIRYATSQDLPITFVIEDNDRSVTTKRKDRWGKHDDFMWNVFVDNPKVLYYRYKSTYPHVGTGKHVSF